jgi:hypothetical protein
MKTNTQLTSIKTLAALSLATLFAASVLAEGVRYESKPVGSKCTITGASGDSAFSHEWTMKSPMIGGYIEADEKFPESALTDAATAKPAVQAKMPVRTFKSGKEVMDNKMQLMMSVTNHPNVEYRLIELKPKSKAGSVGALQFEAVGTLSIAGKTLTNTMPVTIEKKGDILTVKGSAPVKMTEHGITPRVSIPVLGDISIKDEVKIDFEWQLAKKAQAAPAPAK